MYGTAAIIAHQGGWDEALVIATPIVVFVVLLRAAVARAEPPGETNDRPTPR